MCYWKHLDCKLDFLKLNKYKNDYSGILLIFKFFWKFDNTIEYQLIYTYKLIT